MHRQHQPRRVTRKQRVWQQVPTIGAIRREALLGGAHTTQNVLRITKQIAVRSLVCGVREQVVREVGVRQTQIINVP